MKSKYFEMRIRNIVDERALSELENLKVKCECGHSIVMPVYLDSQICTYCGKKVRNNTKLYFMHKMRKELKKSEDKN